MSNYRLIIADTDAKLVDQLTEFTNRNDELNVIGSANNGIHALNLIHSLKPDIVLLDLLLPEMDGISLIRELQKMKNTPIIICMSRFYTPACVEMARNSGASYYVYKPIALSALTSILIECTRMVLEGRKEHSDQDSPIGSSDLLRRIHIFLRDLGFSPKHSGSRYIASSVAIAHESPIALHNLSSGLYRKLAEEENVSEASVERSMRTAIAHANANGILEARIGKTATNKNCIRYILSELLSWE